MPNPGFYWVMLMMVMLPFLAAVGAALLAVMLGVGAAMIALVARSWKGVTLAFLFAITSVAMLGASALLCIVAGLGSFVFYIEIPGALVALGCAITAVRLFRILRQQGGLSQTASSPTLPPAASTPAPPPASAAD